jgi:putative acetyltransferase
LFHRSGEGSNGFAPRACPFVVVIGHPRFYPRFGFLPAVSQGLTCDWDVPAEFFMVNVLTPTMRDRLRGKVEYRARRGGR